MSILIVHPWAAAVVAALFWLLWRWRGARLAGIAAASWAAYLIYEYLMHARILCSGECNIRIDLLIIYPLLGILTVAALLQSLGGASALDSHT